MVHTPEGMNEQMKVLAGRDWPHFSYQFLETTKNQALCPATGSRSTCAYFNPHVKRRQIVHERVHLHV